SIRVVPDLDRFRSELVRELKAIEKSVQGKIKVKADTKGFREEATAKTRNLPDAKVHIDADWDRFKTRMASMMNRNVSRLEAKIPLTPDGERFRRQVAGAERELRHRMADPIDLDLEIASGQREEILTDVETIARLASEMNKIELDVDAKGT